MAMLNVDPEKQHDAFYRYKMPRIQVKIEGNGNGIKTVICNINGVAERLARNVEYPMKFFAYELAATSKFKDDKWILTGSFSQEKIQDSIFDFIKRFVLCKACRNPETVVRVDKQKNIYLDCKACSRTTDIPPNEKLINAILKNEKPQDEKPDKVIAAAEAKEKDGKEKKKKKKTKDEKEAEAFEKNTRQISENDTILTDTIDRENPITVLKNFVNTDPQPSMDDFVSKVLDLKEDYGFTEDKHVVALVFEALFDKDIVNQLSTRGKLMARFIKVDIEKDVIVELMLLCAAEESLKAKFPILLKKFYDKDMIGEEAIQEWHAKKKGPKALDKEVYSYFKKKATPFVEWLSQDDSSSEDDSDSDEPATPVSKNSTTSAPLSAQASTAAADDDDGSDVDIDAI